MTCLHSFRAENKLKSHEKVCKNKDFCGIAMPSKKDKMLEFKQYKKSNKMPYIIYTDLESLIEETDRCENIREKKITVNKKRIRFTWSCKSVLYLRNNIL